MICENAPPLPPMRVMLLDDHEFILRGIDYLLSQEPGVKVVGQFTRSREVVQALKYTPADILIMDFALQPDEMDGLNLVRALRIKFPQLLLLVISALHTPATVSLALRCGAQGFVGKSSDPRQLLAALRELMLGNTYLEPCMASVINARDVSTRGNRDPHDQDRSAIGALIKSNNLTVREREVLRCCLAGMSVTQVAAKFSRSIKTISTQKQSAYRKLGLHSDNELFRIRSQLED